MAQPGGQRGGHGGPPQGGHGGPPQGSPIIDALDVDGNKELSSQEIKNASQALAALDSNGDGVVNREDMGPPGGGRGRGGQRGQGGPPQGSRGQRGSRGQSNDQESSEKVSKSYMKRLMKFDKDDSDTIEKDELPDRMQHVMAKADANGDNVLDESELQAMLTGVASKAGQEAGGRRQRGGRGGHEGPGGHGGPGGEGGPGGAPDPSHMVDQAMEFDADGDGKLSRAELTEFAGSMPGPGGRGGR